MSEKPPQDTEAAGRRKQAWRTVLVLSLMILAVLAAWVGGKVVEAWLVESHQGPQWAISPGPTTQPDDALSLDSPLAAVGLTAFKGDPGGIAPAPAARRVTGFERRMARQVEQQARYELAGSPGVVVAHYEAEMARLGYEKLKDAVQPDGRRAVVFGKRDGWATVSLRRDARNVKMVIIVVTAVSPVSSGTQTKR